MKTLKLFGWLSHFLWASMIILTVFFGILLYSEFRINNYDNWLITFIGRTIDTNENFLYLRSFMITCFVIYLGYFYAITLFNLCVRKFEKRIFFHPFIIKQFKTIGIIFITNYILITILDFVFKIHSEQAITSSTNFSESILNKLSAPMGSLIIGFFFLVLSQVFKEALKQKQENELTI